MGYSSLTNDWDTIFALKIKDVNRIILKNKPALGHFTQTSTAAAGSFTIDGELGGFQIVAPSGDVATGGTSLAVTVPILSGTFSATPLGGQQLNFKLDGGALQVELKLNGGKVITQSGPLTPNPEDVTLQDVTGLPFNDVTAISQLKALFVEYFKATPKLFANEFAKIQLSSGTPAPADAKTDLTWLEPTTVAYATYLPDDFSNAVFGILAMTENQLPPDGTAVLKSGLIPVGADCGFVISKKRFLSKFILPALPALFDGASVGDFSINDEGKAIYNVKALNFSPMNVTKIGGEATATPDIDAKNFTITMEGAALDMHLVDFHYVWSPGVDVYVDYQESSSLQLSDEQLSLNRLSSTTKSRSEISTALEGGLIAAGIVVQILCTGAGVAIGIAVEEAGEAVVTTAVEEGTELASMQVVTLGAEGTDAAAQGAEQAEVTVAAAEVSNTNTVIKSVGFLARNRVKILGGVLGGLTGIVAGGVVAALPFILGNVAEGNSGSIPALDAFALKAMESVKWPYVKSIALTSVTLNNSLQLGGKVTFNLEK